MARLNQLVLIFLNEINAPDQFRFLCAESIRRSGLDYCYYGTHQHGSNMEESSG